MTDLLQTPRPLGGFRTILADPPWAFVTRSRGSRLPQRHTAAQHYPTMSRADLLNLPVRDMAAVDSALVMWVVDSHLKQGIDLGEHWGFEFKTKAFTWLKTDQSRDRYPIGMGYWTRKQTEIALLFTRGKPPRLSGAVREMIMGWESEVLVAPRREHSRKPDVQYERVEALLAGPYLELFARHERPGWTAWGNDVGKFSAPQQVAEPAGIASAHAGQD